MQSGAEQPRYVAARSPANLDWNSLAQTNIRTKLRNIEVALPFRLNHLARSLTGPSFAPPPPASLGDGLSLGSIGRGKLTPENFTEGENISQLSDMRDLGLKIRASLFVTYGKICTMFRLTERASEVCQGLGTPPPHFSGGFVKVRFKTPSKRFLNRWTELIADYWGDAFCVFVLKCVLIPSSLSQRPTCGHIQTQKYGSKMVSAH